jgi:hypothetical protein
MQVRSAVSLSDGFQRAMPGMINMSMIAPEANTGGAASNLTASSILAGMLVRSGPGAGFADTLPTVNALIAAAPHLSVGDSFTFLSQNNSGFTQTVTTNTGWTLTGTMTVATVSTREFLVTITSNKPTRILSGAATTNASAVVTGLTDDDCKAIQPGMLVSGTGISAATTIISVNADSNSMTLSANATATNNPIALTCDPTATLTNVRAALV